MPRLVNDLRAKEHKIIGETKNEGNAIRVRPYNKSEQQKRRENPGKPFDFRRQNKKDVDDLLGIKSRERKEQRCDKHATGKIAAEEERRDRCPDHPDNEIKGEPERAPCALEPFANKPQEPEDQHDPKAECLRDKDVGEQPPDLALANAGRIEVKRKTKIRVEPHQRPYQRGEADHNADQSRDTKKTKAAFEFIQPGHRSPTVAQQSLTSILSLSKRERRTAIASGNPSKAIFFSSSTEVRMKVRSRSRADCGMFHALA